MCRRYRIRPSSVCEIDDPLIAIDFDLAMSAVHRFEDESKANELAQQNPFAALLMMTIVS